MTRILLWFFLFSTVLVLSACTVPLQLYPVQGPLAMRSQNSVLKGKAQGSDNGGTITINLENGEICTGRFAPVHPTTPAQAPVDAQVVNVKPADWDAIYGTGYYVANVLGAPVHVRASLGSGKGTTMSMEIYTNNAQRALGVAVDSLGNLYKVAM